MIYWAREYSNKNFFFVYKHKIIRLNLRKVLNKSFKHNGYTLPKSMSRNNILVNCSQICKTFLYYHNKKNFYFLVWTAILVFSPKNANKGVINYSQFTICIPKNRSSDYLSPEKSSIDVVRFGVGFVLQYWVVFRERAKPLSEV